ncbi:hypothetical protein DTL42_23635 [Bremerella cremea]|uniref:Uncharacterized protein n=1 Tax=Bremerella cremea TaxID=1031537 RepID=A0A368KL93_9BACT|nr:hypothetical protein [Bremerella cremea]RCS41541.1 hypothetical protein DTL42_23635 [Bremerella cremea]
MNVPTIEMDQEQALAKLKAYRRELHHGADEVYQAAAQGYEALAKGLKLIDIGQAISQGGTFPDQFPRLAIARADRQVVKCVLQRGRTTFDASREGYGSSLIVQIANDLVNTWETKYTRIPIVPADVRQELRAMKRSVDLRRYHILWEVEAWYDRNPIVPPEAMKNSRPHNYRGQCLIDCITTISEDSLIWYECNLGLFVVPLVD